MKYLIFVRKNSKNIQDKIAFTISNNIIYYIPKKNQKADNIIRFEKKNVYISIQWVTPLWIL